MSNSELLPVPNPGEVAKKTTFDEIHDILISSLKDQEKFYKNGNAAAGTRLRKIALTIGKLTHKVRKEISEKKNA